MPDSTLPDVRVQTLAVLFASTRGMGANGVADMVLVTPEGQPNYVTTFGPAGLSGLHQNIKDLLAGLGEVPAHIPLPGTALPGQIPDSPQTKEFFGQTYDVEVLQMLGVLVMRANLLDQALIELDSAVTGMPLAQAEARYHASTNMKARLDTIRASISASAFNNHMISGVIDALDTVKGITDRRNALIHAHWTFRNGKHRAKSARPNTAKPVTEITVTKKNIMLLAEDYYSASVLLLGVTRSLAVIAAEIAAPTPSATEPKES